MKIVSNEYKEDIRKFGKQIDSKITYTIENEEIELDTTQLNSITPSFQGSILKSVMKQLEIDSNVEIPINTQINYRFGLLVGNEYEYVDYGDYIVYQVEKNEATNSYIITAYDKMLYAMKDYEALNVTYPISVRDYIIALCEQINLEFKNAQDQFANYDKMLPNELYLNEDGNSIGYTYRDVLDELAQVTASTICINDNNQLEIRYINEAIPTPTRPSKNIVDTQGFQNGYINTSGSFVSDNKTALLNYHIPVETGKTYCFSTNANVDNMVISMFGSSDNFLRRQKVSNTKKLTQTMANDVAYVRLAVNYNNSTTMTQAIIDSLEIMCEEGNDRTVPYEPYGPIEMGKNLLDTSEYEKGYYKANGQFVADDTIATFSQYIPVQDGVGYNFSLNTIASKLYLYVYDENKNLIDYGVVSNKSQDYTTASVEENNAYFRYGVKYNNNEITDEVIEDLQIMVEESQIRTTPYEPYIEPQNVETIDEHSLKDINVNFGEKYGPINSIVLSRADSDNIYLQDEESVEQNGLCEIKIIDNQIMNGNDRVDYLQDILDQLDGLEYYINDYSSTGITYFDLCDRYNVQIGENTYPCIMFNDEVNITQGLEELIHTDTPEDSETDYTKADKTDRRINQTTLIVDKHEQEINALINMVQDISNVIVGTGSVTLENAFKGGLHRLEIKGNLSNIFPGNQSNLYGYSLMINDDLMISNDTTISSGVPYQNQVPYPSTTLYPKDSYLQVDNTLYKLNLDYLNYIGEATHDTYVFEEGRQWIERNVGIDAQGNMYALDETVIEEGPQLFINVDNSSTITLLSHPNASLRVEYLLDNKYTSAFAQKVYVDSSIVQTVDSIEQKVSSVSDTQGNITSASIKLALNVDESEIKIQGDQIALEGTITANEGFMIDTNGNMICNNGTFNGGNIELYGDKNDQTLFRVDDNDSRWSYVTPMGVTANRRIDENNIISCGFSSYLDDPYSSDAVYTTIGSSIGHYNDGTYTSTGLWDLHTLNEYCEFWLYAEGTPTIIMTSADGTIQASAFVNTSTKEKKKNIKKLKNALDIIKSAEVYSYNWQSEEDTRDKKSGTKKHYGLVIGDKYKTPKEFIHNDKDGKEDGIDIYATLSFCIKAIQEQQEEIEELQKEIKNLKEEKNGKDKLSK